MLLIIIVSVLLLCIRKISRTVPLNYILLFTFTLLESYVVSFISSYYETNVVLASLILTIAITVGLTIYAFRLQNDLSYCAASLYSATFGLLVFGIIVWFMGFSFGRTIFSLIGAILCSFYIIYDTKYIISGNKYKL